MSERAPRRFRYDAVSRQGRQISKDIQRDAFAQNLHNLIQYSVSLKLAPDARHLNEYEVVFALTSDVSPATAAAPSPPRDSLCDAGAGHRGSARRWLGGALRGISQIQGPPRCKVNSEDPGMPSGVHESKELPVGRRCCRTLANPRSQDAKKRLDCLSADNRGAQSNILALGLAVGESVNTSK
jgi:hypothetical protein